MTLHKSSQRVKEAAEMLATNRTDKNGSYNNHKQKAIVIKCQQNACLDFLIRQQKKLSKLLRLIQDKKEMEGKIES